MQIQLFRTTRGQFRFSLVLLASIVSCAVLAAERIPVDVAALWGLLGSWAVDCQGRPSGENPLYRYVMIGDSLRLRRDTGTLQDENKVISAAVADDGSIELVTEFKAFSVVLTSV